MGTSAGSSRRKVRLDNNNRGRAGEFFEHLALSVVGGQFNETDDSRYGDIVDWKLRLGIEVKSSDNGHPFRIGLIQKRRYEQVIFPLDHFAYCLCSYRNRVSSRTGGEYLRTRGRKALIMTLLHRFDKKSDQFKLLSEKVDEVFLLDIEIMNALEKKFGIHPSSHPGRQGEKEVRLRRKDLRPLVNGSFASMMVDMNLDPKEWMRGKYQVERQVEVPDIENKIPATYTSKFVFYSILRRKLHRRFVSSRKLSQRSRAPYN